MALLWRGGYRLYRTNEQRGALPSPWPLSTRRLSATDNGMHFIKRAERTRRTQHKSTSLRAHPMRISIESRSSRGSSPEELVVWLVFPFWVWPNLQMVLFQRRDEYIGMNGCLRPCEQGVQ